MDGEKILNFVMENWDTISVIIIAVLSLIKATKWGSNQRAALDLITRAIEEADVTYDAAGRVKVVITKRRQEIIGDKTNEMIEVSIDKARDEFQGDPA